MQIENNSQHHRRKRFLAVSQLSKYICSVKHRRYASPYHFCIGQASQVGQVTDVHPTPSQADRFVAGKRQ